MNNMDVTTVPGYHTFNRELHDVVDPVSRVVAMNWLRAEGYDPKNHPNEKDIDLQLFDAAGMHVADCEVAVRPAIVHDVWPVTGPWVSDHAKFAQMGLETPVGVLHYEERKARYFDRPFLYVAFNRYLTTAWAINGSKIQEAPLGLNRKRSLTERFYKIPVPWMRQLDMRPHLPQNHDVYCETIDKLKDVQGQF